MIIQLLIFSCQLLKENKKKTLGRYLEDVDGRESYMSKISWLRYQQITIFWDFVVAISSILK